MVLIVLYAMNAHCPIIPRTKQKPLWLLGVWTNLTFQVLDPKPSAEFDKASELCTPPGMCQWTTGLRTAARWTCTLRLLFRASEFAQHQLEGQDALLSPTAFDVYPRRIQLGAKSTPWTVTLLSWSHPTRPGLAGST
jgi:hypothetical protein